MAAESPLRRFSLHCITDDPERNRRGQPRRHDPGADQRRARECRLRGFYSILEGDIDMAIQYSITLTWESESI